MKVEMTFGDWLKRRRRQLDLTQMELARRVSCAEGTIRKLESNARRPSAQLAQLLATHLEIPLQQQPAFIRFARAKAYTADIATALAAMGENLLQPSPLPLPTSVWPETAPASNGVTVIPTQLTPFIGRSVELATLHDLLADPDIRLITIVGPGGMGKTRLALACGQQQLSAGSHFPNGIFFVNLAPLNEAGQIISALANALGFQLQSGQDGRSSQQQLLDYLRTKQLLLLLDNFEHLLDGAELVTNILRAASAVKILTTSRERLHLQSEQVFPIHGLEFPDGETASPNGEGEEAKEYTAVQLFLQSARRNQPDFALLTGDNFAHLTRICRLVAGMPLAIELAATWVDTLPLAEIAAVIQADLDFLETDRRDMPERHRSIRAMIAVSWQRLSQTEQDVFAQLSIFRGGFTRQAAQAVAGATPRLLAHLVNKSFLQYDPLPDRYQIHELMRQFGAEKLKTLGQLKQTRADYTDYFLTFVHNREADVKGHRQLAACAEIKAEFEGIRIAWNYAIQDKKFELLDKVITTLYVYTERVFNFVAYQELQQQAVTALAVTVHEISHPVWYRLVSRHARPREQEIELLEKALAYARQQGDLAEITHCLGVLVWTRLMTGTFEGFIPLLEESLAIAHQLNDRFQLVELHFTQGMYYQLLGQMDKAIETYQKSVALAESQGDVLGAARVRQYLCYMTLWGLGNFAQAQTEYHQLVAFYEQLSRTSAVAYIQVNLGYLAFFRGEFMEAERLAQAAWVVLGESGNKIHMNHVRYLRGLLAVGQTNYFEAIHFYQEIHLHYVENEQRFLYAWSSAMIAYGLGKLGSMRQHLQEAIDFSMTPPQMGMMALVLPVAALFFSQMSMNERSVALLALTYKHPASITGWLEKTPLFSGLRLKLESVCGVELFAVIWQHGQELDLQQTAEHLLQELTELGWGEQAD